jgi:hypothetical protein
MMNKSCYANLSDLKGVLGLTSTTDDVALRDTLLRASKEIDSYTGRSFYSVSATKYFDGATHLWIPDLLNITASGVTLDEEGSASFDSTMASTDYIEYGGGSEDALNTFPITHLEISMNSDYGGFASGIKKGVKIIGNWGYGDGTSAPYLADTTLSASMDATETSASVTSGANLNAGMTLLIESEQMFINSGSSPIVVERGVNGSTKAEHANATQIYYYRYPEDIKQACLDLSVALYQNRSKQGLQSERLGDYSYTIQGTSLNKGQIESMLDDKIHSYRKMRF